MRRRAVHVLPHGNSTNPGDLLRDLGPRKQPSQARLRPLAELDFHRTHGIRFDLLQKEVQVEAAGFGAAAEVACPELPDQVTTKLMIWGDAPFSCVVEASRNPGSLVHRTHGGARQRAKTHRRDVHDRIRAEGPRPASSATQRLRAWKGIGLVGTCLPVRLGGSSSARTHDPVFDDDVVGRRFELVIRAEAEVIVLLLTRRVDPPPLVPREGPLLIVVGDDVLPQLGADGFQ